MRTNNSRSKTAIISVYFILVIVSAFAAVFNVFREFIPNSILALVLILVVFLVIFLLIHWMSKYFEYDSDGGKIVITNKGLLLSDRYDYREHIIEFDKENLLDFKFGNRFFYKSLIVWYIDDIGQKKRDIFNVTLVTSKKIKYVRQSLSKMVRQNRKQKTV